MGEKLNLITQEAEQNLLSEESKEVGALNATNVGEEPCHESIIVRDQ